MPVLHGLAAAITRPAMTPRQLAQRIRPHGQELGIDRMILAFAS